MTDNVVSLNLLRPTGNPPQTYRIDNIQKIDDTYLIELIDDSDANSVKVISQIPTLNIRGTNLKQDDIVRVYFSYQKPLKDIAAGYEFRRIDTIELTADKGVNYGPVVTPFRKCANGREYVVEGISKPDHGDYNFITLSPGRWDNPTQIQLAVHKNDTGDLNAHQRIIAEWGPERVVSIPNTNRKYALLKRFEILGFDDDAVRGIIPEHTKPSSP